MFAFVKHSGKQFKVHEGAVITVDKTDAQIGSEIEIKDIKLIVNDNNEISTTPSGSVVCEVVEHFKGDKVVILKFRKKKCYKRKKGHRQEYTKLRVKKIAAK